MDRSLLDILVDPVDKTPLRLEASVCDGNKIIEGTLHGGEGRTYAITGGIPRFVLTEDVGQRQGQESFGYKWQQRGSYDSPEMLDFTAKWISGKYNFASAEAMRAYFAGRKRILDAGCGSGLTSSTWLTPGWQGSGTAAWIGADISVAADVAQERLGHIAGTHFVQADITQLPFPEGTFDTIFSEGVLHHTPSTEGSLKALVPLLEPDSEIMFYIYRRKGPIREFTDDYIRQTIANLPPEEAWEILRPLTKLGQALAELDVEVEVPEDIPFLGIQAGRQDVQRLIYWNFAKMFWNSSLPFEENHLINFDWYHPRYAHRQTEEDIRRWCAEAGLKITYFHTEESGFTVRVLKG